MIWGSRSVIRPLTGPLVRVRLQRWTKSEMESGGRSQEGVRLGGLTRSVAGRRGSWSVDARCRVSV